MILTNIIAYLILPAIAARIINNGNSGRRHVNTSLQRRRNSVRQQQWMASAAEHVNASLQQRRKQGAAAIVNGGGSGNV